MKNLEELSGAPIATTDTGVLCNHTHVIRRGSLVLRLYANQACVPGSIPRQKYYQEYLYKSNLPPKSADCTAWSITSFKSPEPFRSIPYPS